MQATSCDCTGCQACSHLRTRPTKLILQPSIVYDKLSFLTVTLTPPDMLAAVQTRHMVRASGVSHGPLATCALSEAAHGNFGNTQY